jgi:hypothetical protein
MMDAVIYIKVDADDSGWLKNQDVISFFPEHYSPSFIDSEDELVVDVAFPGGKGRFTFNENEVECHFEYYDDDEDYDAEWSEFNSCTDNMAESLVKYIADEISGSTGFSTNCV